ncbi:MAG: ATP-binding cassette domain-containing protein [Egibacteraceae bacterium]
MPQPDELAIEAAGLVRHFGDVKAVDGVDLAVRRGGVYGFLEPNGAGKTTTIRMLATLLKPDSGTTTVLGHDIIREAAQVRRRVSLTTQYLDEADQLAGRIAVIDNGRVIAEGTSADLKAQVGGGTLRVRVRDPDQRGTAEQVLSAALAAPAILEADPAALSITVADVDRAAHALADLAGAGVAVTDFHLGQPSLDEVFLALTGHSAEGPDDQPTEDAA